MGSYSYKNNFNKMKVLEKNTSPKSSLFCSFLKSGMKPRGYDNSINKRIVLKTLYHLLHAGLSLLILTKFYSINIFDLILLALLILNHLFAFNLLDSACCIDSYFIRLYYASLTLLLCNAFSILMYFSKFQKIPGTSWIYITN